MNPVTVRGLAAEIAPRVAGSRVVDVVCPGADCLILELAAPATAGSGRDVPPSGGRGHDGGGPDGGRDGHGPDGRPPERRPLERLRLGIVTTKALPLLFLSEEPPPAPGRAPRPAFAAQLVGATLVSLSPLADRAGVRTLLRWTSPAGRTVERSLIVDLGRNPRLALRDGGGGAPDAGPAEEPASAPSATVTWWRDSTGRLHARLSSGRGGRETAGETLAFTSLNEAACHMFREFWPVIDLDRRRGVLARAVERRLRRTRRAIEKVQSEIDDGGRADEYRHKGQLLLTRQSEVARGSSSVTVLDYDNATPVTIELDPALGPQQNAETYFRRARKSDRRSERAPMRLGELEEKAERLERAASAVAGASAEELGLLEEQFLPREARRRGPGAPRERARFRTYHVSGGWEVLVGKSSRDNDILTHKLARPDDLWFHARQAAGSHVLLRRSGSKAEPSRQAILEAAAIAAFHSKAGKSSKVSVCYTEKRHVRRARGAPVGQAVVTREKVVMVRPKLPDS